ncbi:MAG: DNA mismatch repair protein MutS [Sphaerochaetaceae bacterium]|jgi:DNA mismatch repair protein MutS|nr:DNA mismatch repair protein MutS [Sphaerochaetaceae bacterium]MDD3162417.1 DNA mismatch repair protein MutS [Sphaerochaetaceae bacterium]MDD4006752.1 DNA mismatch repair protein MutS [Sphaerochaetaceae bacterium]
MQQYFSIKEKYKDEVLFFRLGDFYEMFDEDAIEISRLLNLTLTHRSSSPMCGIPFHAAKNYIKRLLGFGKKIAICEQLELSDKPSQIAKREVIQVITPATVVEQEFLESGSFNYLLAIFGDTCAYCDITTGDLRLKALSETGRIDSILTVMEQIRPSEIIVCDDEYFLKPDFKEALDSRKCMIDKLPASYFSVKSGYDLLCQATGAVSLQGFGIKENDRLLAPAGAILRYVKETAKISSKAYFNCSVVSEAEYLQIDESTRKNLELFENSQDHSQRYSLFDTICRTVTSGGRRMLESWLSFPLVRIEEIDFRQDWVRWFVANKAELDAARQELSSTMDLQRLANRVVLKRAIPRDLVGIKQTLGSFFTLMQRQSEKYASLLPDNLDSDKIGKLADLMMELEHSVSEECTGPFLTGSVIIDGYDPELDKHRSMVSRSDELFDQYLQKIKAETGITIMRIVYSRVSGYVVEVPKSQIPKVPDSFFRRQTLVNCERYTTEELSSLEIESQMAASEAEKREKELYDKLLEAAASYSSELNSIGRFLSTIDCFQSFASQAVIASYCCPAIVSDDVLEIHGGRHPVVENNLPPSAFVPNDTIMDQRFFLITGPNMAGKSTYLRQTALIVLLAHIGSFVPAQSAVIGITDKIFCRVGASDNLAKGESTFLVEMQEASFIIRTCTRRSLVIMDEIGRGTSTQEGMSIAYAIIRFLLERGSKTLFATHFHELAMMDTTGMALYTLSVKETPSTIQFLRKLIPGTASSSYALHVARMAGIPASVIREAAKFQKKHFADYGTGVQDSLFADAPDSELRDSLEEARLSSIKAEELVHEILDFDIDSSTPFQAMVELQKLKEKARCF